MDIKNRIKELTDIINKAIKIKISIPENSIGCWLRAEKASRCTKPSFSFSDKHCNLIS